MLQLGRTQSKKTQLLWERGVLVGVLVVVPVLASAELCNSLLSRTQTNPPIYEGVPSTGFEGRLASTNGSLNYRPHDHRRGYGGHGVPACIRTFSEYRDGSGTNEIRHGQTPFLMTNNPDKPGDGTFWQGPQLIPVTIVAGSVWRDYWHVIVDDSDAGGMKLEYYIEAGFRSNFIGVNGGAPTKKPSHNYGTQIADSQHWSSASAGDGVVDMATGSSGNKLVTDGGNAFYPLANKARSGSGSGNPTRVIVRQTLDVGEIKQDFLKGYWNKKPYIDQTLADADIYSKVTIDMQNSTYSQDHIPGKFGFEVTVADGPSTHSWQLVSNPGTHYYIEAGRYKYTAASDTPSTPGGASGQYAYKVGTFDLDSVDWTSYYDSSVGNVWGYGWDAGVHNKGHQPANN